MKVFGYLLLACIAVLAATQAVVAQALRNGLGDASSIVTPYRGIRVNGKSQFKSVISATAVLVKTPVLSPRDTCVRAIHQELADPFSALPTLLPKARRLASGAPQSQR